MYYINCYSFLNSPDKDWEELIEQSKRAANSALVI